jgi:CheY-like chemotaxis protein
MSTLPRVLIVEDDAAIRNMLVAALGREPLTIDSASDGVEGLEKLAAGPYEVIIVDLMMPRMDGFTLLDALPKIVLPVSPLIFVMTAYDDAALLKLDPRLVHGTIKNPFDVAPIVEMIRDAAEQLHAHTQTNAATEPPAPSPDIAHNIC